MSPAKDVLAELPQRAAAVTKEAALSAQRELTQGLRAGLSASKKRTPQGVGSIVSVQTARPEFVLTFDDGPSSGRTQPVLAALAEAGASATFFVLMTRVRRERELLDEVIAAGHEIGLHGADHRKLTRMRPDLVWRSLHDAKHELEDVTGTRVRWFRPPYGHQNPATFTAMKRAGMDSVLWSATSWDWRDISQEERVAKAMSGLTRGAIMLFHDGHADSTDRVNDGAEPNVDRYDLVTRVLAGAAERGFVGRSLGAALAQDHTRAVREARFSV